VHWLRSGDGGKASGTKALFIPINAANLDHLATHWQTETLEQVEFAGPDGRGRQTLSDSKSNGENAYTNAESLPVDQSNAGRADANGYSFEAATVSLVRDGAAVDLFRETI
jgi:hypothetical protein